VQKRIVLDTNVLESATRSRQGASYRLLSLVGLGRFEICLSVPLILEYEAALLEQLDQLAIERRDVAKLLDYLASVAHHQEVFLLWRPHLRDPKDDMVLELAVAAGASRLITHNVRDFQGAHKLEVNAVTPRAFLAELGKKR